MAARLGPFVLGLLLVVPWAACESTDTGPKAKSTAPAVHAAPNPVTVQAPDGKTEAQTQTAKTGAPRIQFDAAAFDFGEVEAGEKVEHIFTFRNVGDAALHINKVRGS